MKKIYQSLVLTFIFVTVFSTFSFAKTITTEELVDNFQKSTDIQKNQILNDYWGKDIAATGEIANAGAYDLFDTTNDIKGQYYRVETKQQKTKNNVPFQVMFLFKDKDKVKDMDKGQIIQMDGKIVRIIDERLQISLWIFCGELKDKDKALFSKDNLSSIY